MSEQLTLSTRAANQAEMSVIMAAMSAVIESGKAVNRAIAAATIARGLDFVRNWSNVERVAETQNRLNAIVRGISDNSFVVRVAPNDGGRVDIDVFARTENQQIAGFPLVALVGGVVIVAGLAWKALQNQSEAQKIERDATEVVSGALEQCKTMKPEDRLACLEKVKSLAKTPEQKSWLGKLLDKIGVGAAGFGVGAMVALGVAVWLLFNSRKTE